ncbi:MAG: TRAP transporter small permease subunit [Geminicoccaceae bacterium]|nr:TRAP transporter small permease subunit [Geminicoccaceae bacterium]
MGLSAGARTAARGGPAVLLALARGLEAVVGAIGRTVRWLAVALVLVQLAVVVLRYAFGTSYIWLQESVIYTHAVLFMLSIGWTLLLDRHVRVDVFYARWSPATKAAVDLLAVLFAALPFCALVIWASWGYVAVSFRLGEGPMQVGGLPLLPWLKALVPAMAILLALAAIAIAARAVLVLAGRAETHLPRRSGHGGPEA